MLLLRSLSQAFYSAGVDIHFGLASEAYAHFTSPIRRYPDLLVHRALWNHWLKKPGLRRLEAAAESSSETERRAIEAEREIVQVAACLVARRRLGEVMPARVTGVHAAGTVRPARRAVRRRPGAGPHSRRAQRRLLRGLGGGACPGRPAHASCLYPGRPADRAPSGGRPGGAAHQLRGGRAGAAKPGEVGGSRERSRPAESGPDQGCRKGPRKE